MNTIYYIQWLQSVGTTGSSVIAEICKQTSKQMTNNWANQKLSHSIKIDDADNDDMSKVNQQSVHTHTVQTA